MNMDIKSVVTTYINALRTIADRKQTFRKLEKLYIRRNRISNKESEIWSSTLFRVTYLGTVANDPRPLVVVAGEIPGLVVVTATHGQIIPRTLVPRVGGRSYIRTAHDWTETERVVDNKFLKVFR